ISLASREGLFTKMLLRTLADPEPGLDANLDGFTTWHEVLKVVAPKTNEYYQQVRMEAVQANPNSALRRQFEQMPYPASLPMNLRVSPNVVVVGLQKNANWKIKGKSHYAMSVQVYIHGLKGRSIQQDVSFLDSNGDPVRARWRNEY